MLSAIFSSLRSVYDTCIGSHPCIRWWDRLDRRLNTQAVTFGRADILICLLFAFTGISLSLAAFHLTETVPGLLKYFDIFLQSDSARVFDNMISTRGNHSRTSVHPLFSILVTPVVITLQMLGLSPYDAAKAVSVAVMGACSGLFCATLRTLGIGRIGVAVYTALFLSSAAVVFWSGIIETFSFGALSIVMALYMMCRAKPLRKIWWVGMSVFTLAFTIVNWSCGLIATAVRFRFKPFLAISLIALMLTGGLAVVQRYTFEKAAIFFNPQLALSETTFTQPVMAENKLYERGWQPLNNIRHIYVTTMVTPPTELDFQNGFGVVTSNQFSAFRSGDVLPVIATLAWVIGFGLGVWGAVVHQAARPAMIGVAGMLAFQTLLHSVYGEITFLYGLHFVPLLVLVAAMSWFSRFRWVGVAAAVVVIVAGGISNVHRLHDTVSLAHCLSDLETVKTYQSWDYIKDKGLPVLDRDQTMAVATATCAAAK